MVSPLTQYQPIHLSEEETGSLRWLNRDHPETTSFQPLIPCEIEMSGQASLNKTVNLYHLEVLCTWRDRLKDFLAGMKKKSQNNLIIPGRILCFHHRSYAYFKRHRVPAQTMQFRSGNDFVAAVH